jgi:hypothetical protein
MLIVEPARECNGMGMISMGGIDLLVKIDPNVDMDIK